jgi:hypothetical protein
MDTNNGLFGSVMQTVTGGINYNSSDAEQRKKQVIMDRLSEKTVARDGKLFILYQMAK